jgi:hypothetical protein
LSIVGVLTLTIPVIMMTASLIIAVSAFSHDVPSRVSLLLFDPYRRCITLLSFLGPYCTATASWSCLTFSQQCLILSDHGPDGLARWRGYKEMTIVVLRARVSVLLEQVIEKRPD